MMELTIQELIDAVGAEYHGPEVLLSRKLSGVAIDSRVVEQGGLFAALSGERVDGHQFMGSALEKGAACVLAQRLPDGVNGPVLLVNDVRSALQQAASYYRGKFSLPVIGVTGSVGKTTAKEMLAAVLSEHYCVHKTQGNFNNELGVPLTLFGLRPEHTAAVIEMGISDFGEMRRLAAMVQPDYAVYTTIGDAHLEFLGDREGVLRAKTEMLDYLAENGTVFVNGDDEWLRRLRCQQAVVRFGTSADCHLRAEHIRIDQRGMTSCDLVGQERRIPVIIPAYGDHMVLAALEGAAVGIQLGLSDREIAAGIAHYETVGHRSRVLRTKRYTVIDDCYNANPTSMCAAIRSMLRLPGRAVCIMGDMLELGENSRRLHETCGAYAVEQGVSLLLGCGEMSLAAVKAAGERGKWFPHVQELMAHLPELLMDGDVILVKASHSMCFEQIVTALEQL